MIFIQELSNSHFTTLILQKEKPEKLEKLEKMKYFKNKL